MFQIFPDNAMKREFLQWKAKCPNVGCDWTGSVKQYEVILGVDMLCNCPFSMYAWRGGEINMLLHMEEFKSTSG